MAAPPDLTLPFTRAEARAAGLSPGVLRGPRFRRLLRGVYVDRDTTVTTRLRCLAALRVHPAGAVVGGLTAAELLALPAPRHADVHVSVGRHADRRTRPGVVVSVCESRPLVAVVEGVPVVAGPDLFTQLAARLSLVDLVVLGDAMVRRGLTSPADLVAAGARFTGTGALVARQAAALVRPRVDSPMETRLRLLLVFAGFAEPTVNPIVADRYRPDLCWPALRLVVEYDGRHHRADLDQWDHDLERTEWFVEHGWRIVVVVARGIFQQPGETLARVHRAWVAAGGAPFELDPRWESHFATTAAA